MTKILVTGAQGQLGRCIRDAVSAYPTFDVFFAARKDLDIQNKEAQSAPSPIINSTTQYICPYNPITEKYTHFSMGDFRGLKRDVWEGGHHIPFIIKWPGQIKSGSVSNELISQIDIMATLTSITGTKLPQGAAPDSYSFLPIIKGKSSSPIRKELIHNTYESK